MEYEQHQKHQWVADKKVGNRELAEEDFDAADEDNHGRNEDASPNHVRLKPRVEVLQVAADAMYFEEPGEPD